MTTLTRPESGLKTRLDDASAPSDGATTSVLGGLADRALATLQATFKARNHHPGGAHWAALTHLMQTMEAMANGTAKPNIFLASLDPGLGKSSSVVEFARALVSSAEHRDVGMLVCVGRLEEARALASEMADAGIRQHVAVRTSDDASNALSGCAAPGAQVLIVTQQKVERETRFQSFRSTSLFHYEGAVRAVRVWDEAWMPGAPITLDRASLGGLFAPAQRLSLPFYRALETMFFNLQAVPDGELFTVPDWTALSGITETDLLAAVKGPSGTIAEETRLTASALFVIAGRTIRVRREAYAQDGEGRVVISYQDTLPSDLAPLLVLDASIRVRQTYADAVTHRDVKMLPKAVKNYEPLTVHLWKTAGSKTAFANNGDVLVKGMAATIMTNPEERWLVITHKQRGRVGDIEAQLRKELPLGVASRVAVRTWGNHMATNEFRDYGNVILGGTLFMPNCHYLALTHLAQDRPPEAHGFADTEAVLRTTHGEHRNLILQAACRGRVRQSNGLYCLPMNLYIIAAPGSAIPTTENIHTMFPGAAIKRWAPMPPRLTGKALDASTVLARLLDGGALAAPSDFLGYGAIAALMPGKDGAVKPMQPGHFNSRVADGDAWRDHLVTLELVETTQAKGGRSPARGLRRAQPDELSDWKDSTAAA